MPTCEECKRYVYDPDNGWKQKTWRGKPMVRRDDETPCGKCPKSRDGTPNPAAEISGPNWECFQHWLTARSGLRVEADELTRENFGLIQLAYERYQKRQASMLNALLVRQAI